MSAIENLPRRLATWALAIASCAAIASNEAPDVLVKRTVEDVLGLIQHTPDRARLRQLAEQKVLPNFDFTEMTKLAVGTNWRKASPQQQQALESGFRTLLVNIYTTALSKSAKQGAERAVDVKPLPPNESRDEALVKTVVRESGGPPLAIDYRMASRDGGWKVYDVLVEGVSLVTNYRTSFDAEVSKGGVDGLIKALQQKNGAPVNS
ncbi:MAG: ABC transporter substrate-binding protein [Betaproteobacteria bacterium]|nr:ABC transporter substrate-binding protein [Betaproteobacteria bacterium]